jgi:hypothetical protein
MIGGRFWTTNGAQSDPPKIPGFQNTPLYQKLQDFGDFQRESESSNANGSGECYAPITPTRMVGNPQGLTVGKGGVGCKCKTALRSSLGAKNAQCTTAQKTTGVNIFI